MSEDIMEAKIEELMAEAERLHDLVYNIECYTTEDRLRMEALYAEIERRGISVIEQYTVTFKSSEFMLN